MMYYLNVEMFISELFITPIIPFIFSDFWISLNNKQSSHF